MPPTKKTDLEIDQSIDVDIDATLEWIKQVEEDNDKTGMEP